MTPAKIRAAGALALSVFQLCAVGRIYAASSAAMTTSGVPALAVALGDSGDVHIFGKDSTIATIHPALYTRGWKNQSVERTGSAGSDSPWTVRLDDGCAVSLSASVSVSKTGVHCVYVLSPDRSVSMNDVRIEAAFPYAHWQGSPYRLEHKAGSIPTVKLVDPDFASADGSAFLGPSAALNGLTVEFKDGSLLATLQDSRTWGSELTVLLDHGEATGGDAWNWRKGSKLIFDFTIVFNRPVSRGEDMAIGVPTWKVMATHALWDERDFNKAAACFREALDRSPGDYETNLDFGMAYLTYGPGDFKEAERLIARAARKGKNVFNQYLLAMAAGLAGDQATADRCSVDYARLLAEGRDRDVRVMAPALAFGRRQYAAMLASRPAMKLYVPRPGWLSHWAAGQFGGDLRAHVVWDPGAVPLSASAETVDDCDAVGDMKLFIDPVRSQKADFRRAESYWESFVFEMLNDRKRERVTWIWMRSRAGRLSGIDYAGLTRVYEQQTEIETNKFYFEHWKPYCESMGLPTDPKLWSPRSPFPEAALYNVFMGYDKTYLAVH